MALKSKLKAPSTWDECKTKEQKEAFKNYLENIDKKGKFRSFDDFIFDSHMKVLSQ